MTIYYQHIGEALWARDGKVSIGTPEGGVLDWGFSDIERYLGDLPSNEIKAAQTKFSEASSVQIWGLPSGAIHAIKNLKPDDTLILLESVTFRYIGKVVFRFSDPLWDLSQHIWGEQRFPLIVLVSGTMCRYHWENFVSDFNFDENYSWKKLQGRTNSISNERVSKSRFHNEQGFFDYVSKTYVEPVPGSL